MVLQKLLSAKCKEIPFHLSWEKHRKRNVLIQ